MAESAASEKNILKEDEMDMDVDSDNVEDIMKSIMEGAKAISYSLLPRKSAEKYINIALPTTVEKHRFLLTTIAKNEESYDEFVNICELHFKETADFIKSKMKRAKVFAAPSYNNGNQNLEADGATMLAESNNNPEIVLELFTEPVQNVKNILVKKTTDRPYYDPNQCYTMSSKKRGTLFFVNFDDFPDPTKFRKGAAIDESNMITLFREFGFEIFYYKNISLKTFHDLIDQLIQSNHLRFTESFVLCVSSHGSSQGSHQLIEFSCGKFGTIADIIGKFNNIRCPSLRGKPKIFIFPMCRGSDEGAVTERYDNRFQTELQGVDYVSPVVTFSDMKICYATTKGYEAYRDGLNGTWYIATFVDILARFAASVHFDDMLKFVGRKMNELCAERSSSCEENVPFYQVTSSEDIGFNKYLFFNPGYYESK